jgi:putative nucleotidyltransferase with HDIG domain
MFAMASNERSEKDFVRDLTAELSSKELIFSTSLNASLKIRKALDNPDISYDDVARVVGAEPVLCAQLLRLSNSVLYNRTGKKVTELRAAVVMLGIAAVRNAALMVSMRQIAAQKGSGQSFQRMEGLWARSMRVAAMSYVVAKEMTSLNADQALLAGLLHDVGKFYILSRAREYKGLFGSDKLVWELVDQWHGKAGAAVLESWRIADEIRIAVRDCRSAQLPLSDAPSLTDVVAAADFLDEQVIARTIDQLDWAAIPAALQNLRLDQSNSASLVRGTQEELRLIMQAIA